MWNVAQEVRNNSRGCEDRLRVLRVLRLLPIISACLLFDTVVFVTPDIVVS